MSDGGFTVPDHFVREVLVREEAERELDRRYPEIGLAIRVMLDERWPHEEHMADQIEELTASTRRAITRLTSGERRWYR